MILGTKSQLSDEQVKRQFDISPLLPILSKVLAVVGVLFMAGMAVVLGLLIGKRTYAEKWPILVTMSGLATYLAIALMNARHALLLWIVTAPFARFAYLNIELGRGIPNLTLNRIMTGVLLVLVLAQSATQRRKVARPSVLDIFLLLYCAAAALSVPSAVLELKSAVQSFFDLVMIPIAVYFLARTLITDRQRLQAVMHALIIVGVYLALLATREQLTGDVWFYPEDRSVQYTQNIRRVVALLGNPAYLATCINMALPWVWYLMLRAPRRRLLYLVIVGVMMAGVYFCMNRSAWGGLVIAYGVMALLIKRFRRYFALMLLVGAVLAVVYWALIVSSATVRERLQAQGPITYRSETWNVALRMIRDNLAFGIGYENFQFYYQRYGQWDVYLRALPTPHNTYLWVMLMGGVIAFLPFMAFLGAVALSALGLYIRGGKQEGTFPDADLAATFLASMAAFWAPALVMDVLTGYYNTMLMFLIIGAFFGAAAGERRKALVAGERRRALVAELEAGLQLQGGRM